MSIGQSIGSSLGRAIGSSLSAGGGYASLVTNGVLAPYVTFTRASSGTYYDSAGVLQTALTDIPRIDYDPSTLALRGLLIEEERTNLLTYSEQFDDAAWIKSGITISANTTTTPAGVVTGDTVEVSVAGGSKSIREDKTVSALQYTFSVFVRAGTDSVLDIGIYQGGFVAQSAKIISGPGTLGGGAGLQTISSLSSSEWTRIAVTSTAALSAAAASFYCYPGGAINSVGDSVILWGAQLEAGAFATSYIPTTSAAVTRAADNGVLNTLSTIGYNALEGALYAEVMRPALSGSALIADFRVSSGNRIGFGNNIGGGGVTEWDCYVQNASADQAFLRSATAVAGQPVKIACSWKANDFALSIDGGAAITDVSGSLPSPTTLSVGRNGDVTKWLNGYLKNLRYYQRKMNVQALTA